MHESEWNVKEKASREPLMLSFCNQADAAEMEYHERHQRPHKQEGSSNEGAHVLNRLGSIPSTPLMF